MAPILSPQGFFFVFSFPQYILNFFGGGFAAMYLERNLKVVLSEIFHALFNLLYGYSLTP
jgi:hypothetical protein